MFIRQVLLTVSVFAAALCCHDIKLAQGQSVRWQWSVNPKEAAGIEAILQRLDEPMPPGVGASGASPLKSLLDDFPIPTLLDVDALLEESVSPEEPIMHSPFPGQTLRSYLNTVLDPLVLTWRANDGYLLITTRKTSSTVLCMYDVSSIVSGHTSLLSSKEEISSRYRAIINLIESTIQADQWQSAGGTSNIQAWRVDGKHLMAVLAPYETQFAIQDLFAAKDRLTGGPVVAQKQKTEKSKGQVLGGNSSSPVNDSVRIRSTNRVARSSSIRTEE